VLALWSGLGYYSRARQLRRAARTLVERHAGRRALRPRGAGALPGVGRYTLGAVSPSLSTARAAGGRQRGAVLSRVEALDGTCAAPRGPSPLAPGRSTGAARAPGDFNQALMELGATLCTPRAPAAPSAQWPRSAARGRRAIRNATRRRAGAPRSSGCGGGGAR